MKDFAKRLLKGDIILLCVIILLMLTSLLVIFSSTGRLAYYEQGGNTWHYFFKQLGLCISGLVIMWSMRFFSWKWLYDHVGLILLAAAGLVALAAFGGENINGAGRWLRVPIIGITFQPSEIAKIAVVLFSAKLLSEYQETDKCSSDVLKFFWTPLVVIFLIFLDNFSTSVLVALVCLLMCWVGRVQNLLLLKWLGIGVSTLVIVIILGITFPSVQKAGRIGTIVGRLVAWVDKDRDTDKGKNYNYQSDQAHIAVAKGGMTGCGPGNSIQRNFLPHPYSDFIYAIIIEEYGLVGGIFIFFLYTIILFRVGVIAHKTLKTEHLNARGGPEIFPALVVIGLGFSIVLQAMFHMAVNVGAMPVTGQTLPLVSMGGTSMWFVLAALGLILNIAYDYSSDGFTERSFQNQFRTKNFNFEQFDNVADKVYDGKNYVVKKTALRRTDRRKNQDIDEDIASEDFDMINENGLPNLEEQLQGEGRKVVQELKKRGRRGGINEL